MKNLKFPFTLFLLVLFLNILQKNPGHMCAQVINPLFKEDKCISCHQEIELMPQDFHENDIHLQEGLSCVGCHGGDPNTEDPEEAMDPNKGFVGIPSRRDIPKFCGKCHSDINFMRTYQPRIATDQVQQFYTSVHGIQLRKGDLKVAECVSCHTAHAILPAIDPRASTYPLNIPKTCKKCHSDKKYMEGYQISLSQYDDYVNSVHGFALLEKEDTGAPACNDCHGNHGAIPPGIESISHVCGNCHANNMLYFESSSMAEPFKELGIHACDQCHGYHDIQITNDNMVSVGEESVCTDCHSSGDDGYEAAENIHKDLKEFANEYNAAEVKLKEVQQKGMDDVDILFLLQEAHQILIHSRTLVHTFDPEKIHEKKEEGLQKINAAIALAHKEIENYFFRRRGFGIATLFITLLVIALYFKIKEIEKKEE